MARKAEPDVVVTDNGTTLSFELKSAAARDWVAENVEAQSWQWMGRNILVVDWRIGQPLSEGMIEAGLVVA